MVYVTLGRMERQGFVESRQEAQPPGAIGFRPLRLSFLGLTPAWAMLGLALARARWFVIVGVGLLACAYQFFSPFLASPDDAVRFPVWSLWIPVGLILATAAIARQWSVRARRTTG